MPDTGAAADASAMLEAALGYAARGWRVVPLHTPGLDGRCSCSRPGCASNGKHPRTARGLLDATCDGATIRQWWLAWPDANIGIVTGEASGLLALDIDPRHDGDSSLHALAAAHGMLPDTVESLTGSGGRHILFQHPGGKLGNSAGRLGVGLDTRGDGGYIVAPPSLHASGRRYEWEASSEPEFARLQPLPAWMLAILRPPERAAPPAGQVSPSSAMRRARAWLAKRPGAVEGQGGDAHTFATAANLVNDFGLDEDAAWALLCEWNETCEPPWDEQGLRKKLDSAMRNGKAPRGSKPDRPRQHPEAPPMPDEPPGWLSVVPDEEVAEVIPLRPETPTRPLKSRSYLSLVTILETPRLRRRVLGNSALEWNEMTNSVTLDRRALRDVDYSIIRAEIERKFQGDKDGGGLKFSTDDVVRGVQQVAAAAPYHPVREYLRGLRWDGVRRWDTEALDSIGAERSPLNQALLRKWAVSAVARALQPGCKVDTVLILKGGQGLAKTSWFGALGGEWTAESTMDLENKESFMVLQRSWIVEWAELETLAKARNQTAVKAFITSTHDVYVPKYGREVIRQPRSCVIVGTTNEQVFLADPTGNRRYWPITVSGIDLAYVAQHRDQLWAEAVADYEASVGQPFRWWLSPEETAALEGTHETHTEEDPWQAPLALFLAGRPTDVIRMDDVLSVGLGIPTGRQSMAEAKRAGACLRRLGYEKRLIRTDGRNGPKAWMWAKVRG